MWRFSYVCDLDLWPADLDLQPTDLDVRPVDLYLRPADLDLWSADLWPSDLGLLTFDCVTLTFDLLALTFDLLTLTFDPLTLTFDLLALTFDLLTFGSMRAEQLSWSVSVDSSSHFTVMSLQPVGHKKTCHFIFDHNSCVSWSISTLCASLKTGRNTLSGNYKICNITTTLSLHYLRKFENTQNSTTVGDRFLLYVWLNQLCTTFAESHLSFIVSSSC